MSDASFNLSFTYSHSSGIHQAVVSAKPTSFAFVQICVMILSFLTNSIPGQSLEECSSLSSFTCTSDNTAMSILSQRQLTRQNFSYGDHFVIMATSRTAEALRTFSLFTVRLKPSLSDQSLGYCVDSFPNTARRSFSSIINKAARTRCYSSVRTKSLEEKEQIKRKYRFRRRIES